MESSGNLTISNNSNLTLNGISTLTGGIIAGAGQFTIPETLTINSGTVQSNINKFMLTSAGTIDGTGNLDFTGGQFFWLGKMIGDGWTRFTANSLVKLNGGELSRTAHNISGLVYWETGDFTFDEGVFINDVAGLFEIKTAGTMTSQGFGDLFINNGILKTSSIANATASIDINLAQAGTLDLRTGTLRFTNDFTQDAGQTLFNDGNLKVLGRFTIGQGSLIGSTLNTMNGNIFADEVYNHGHIDLRRPGGNNRLNIKDSQEGNNAVYVQSEFGELSVQVGIQVVHDLFEVFGEATLGGVLTVTYAQEPLPNAASTWIPVRFASRNNTQFSTINLPVNFTSTYGNDRLTIEYDPEEEPVGDDEIEIEP